MGFFITKKQKQLMKERRRKMKQFADSGGVLTDEKVIGKENKKRHHSETTITTKAASALPTTEQKATSVIVIPANLYQKDAKKFRKDARRKARERGHDESLLVFESPHDEQAASAAPPPRKRPKQSFPSIKELVEQEKKLKVQQQKDDVVKSEEDALTDAYKSRYVALDCEMVGIGSSGKQGALARVSITDWDGKELMDTFVKVPSRVTDFRTHVSGVKPKHLRNAMEVNECRQAVSAILKDKILVGHALKNDLDALLLQHPKQDVRDTAKYRPFQRLGNNKWRPRKLRDLVKENLDKAIQVEGESHDSLEDARATMELFQLVRKQWEAELLEKPSKTKA
ncbi:hypothetical protein MPSEU_001021100 [Mayamaea pseudoterrestris]|nr:hypothetical protein MPSEU_001021100 [Mayamaea pseudoterrestris]